MKSLPCRNCGLKMRACCSKPDCTTKLCPGCGTVYDWRRDRWVDYSRKRPPEVPEPDRRGRIR